MRTKHTPEAITVGSGDQTEYIQSFFENPELNHYKFTQGESDGKILVSGDRGGIFYLENKQDLFLVGKSKEDKTHVYTTEAGTPRYEGRIEYYQRSLRKAFRYINCSGIVKNLIYSSNNNTPTDKDGRPEYYVRREFEVSHDISDCQNLTLEGCESHNSWGDAFYIGGNNNDNISIINCKATWSGRLAVGIVQGRSILIDGFEADIIRRGGFNIEPNFAEAVVENVVFRNSKLESGLCPFPMGKLGNVQNILVENNEYLAGQATTLVNCDGITSFRKNIIFRGNKRIGGFGSPQASYVFYNVENILIEEEINNINIKRSRNIIELTNCKNVTIRNNDFGGGMYIMLYDTDVSELKIYGNKQKIFLKIITKDEAGEWFLKETIPAEEYDVEKHGEPDVPKDPVLSQLKQPDPVPEPQPPVEPIPEPEKPTDPKPEVPREPETPAPPIEQPEKTKEWYKNKLLWVGGVIVLVIILALVL